MCLIIYDRGLYINLDDFFEFFYEEKHTRIILLLHGWEWLIVLFFSLEATGYNSWTIGLTVGYIFHILTDYIYNKAPIYSYSLYWRWKHGFHSETIFSRSRGYNPTYRI